ncbi:hypothetical protein [Streptomyces sp. NBC_00696]|uniref:hypothetical protein n=1 Tax=Streptomyces sp. NBC_00696 TaxID=2903672 RepID=UPI002E2FE652|nr:hypothetical protein [Streptomyces sp. NBC_00696]
MAVDAVGFPLLAGARTPMALGLAAALAGLVYDAPRPILTAIIGSGTDLGESSRSVTPMFDSEESGLCDTVYALSFSGQN